MGTWSSDIFENKLVSQHLDNCCTVLVYIYLAIIYFGIQWTNKNKVNSSSTKDSQYGQVRLSFGVLQRQPSSTVFIDSYITYFITILVSLPNPALCMIVFQTLQRCLVFMSLFFACSDCYSVVMPNIFTELLTSLQQSALFDNFYQFQTFWKLRDYHFKLFALFIAFSYFQQYFLVLWHTLTTVLTYPQGPVPLKPPQCVINLTTNLGTSHAKYFTQITRYCFIANHNFTSTGNTIFIGIFTFFLDSFTYF